jgi:hypothetical protein
MYVIFIYNQMQADIQARFSTVTRNLYSIVFRLHPSLSPSPSWTCTSLTTKWLTPCSDLGQKHVSPSEAERAIEESINGPPCRLYHLVHASPQIARCASAFLLIDSSYSTSSAYFCDDYSSRTFQPDLSICPQHSFTPALSNPISSTLRATSSSLAVSGLISHFAKLSLASLPLSSSTPPALPLSCERDQRCSTTNVFFQLSFLYTRSNHLRFFEDPSWIAILSIEFDVRSMILEMCVQWFWSSVGAWASNPIATAYSTFPFSVFDSNFQSILHNKVSVSFYFFNNFPNTCTQVAIDFEPEGKYSTSASKLIAPLVVVSMMRWVTCKLIH